jgi:hypothetical protein
MNEQSIFPFGFLREDLLRNMAHRNLCAASVQVPYGQHIIAVGVPGAGDDHTSEEQLTRLLPSIDAAIIFAGMKFEGNARERSRGALLETFKAHDIAVHLTDHETLFRPLGSTWRDMSMRDAFDFISNALLDLVQVQQIA